jgi:hypothetical protein
MSCQTGGHYVFGSQNKTEMQIQKESRHKVYCFQETESVIMEHQSL